jgi:hypothetical protein
VAPLTGLYECYLTVGIQFTTAWTWSALQAGVAAGTGTPSTDLLIQRNIYQSSVPAGASYVRLGGMVGPATLTGGTTYGLRYQRILYSEVTRNFIIFQRRFGIRLIRAT